MIIKSFENFKIFLEKDSTIYEYGCLLLNLDIPFWEKLLSKIDPSDLYQPQSERYGLEYEPHCTILYGIHSDVSDEDVVEKFRKLKKQDFDLVIKGIDCFYNKDYDVLKLNVESMKLRELNEIAKSLPHTSNFSEYKPHITLGYLLKGRGVSYINTNVTVPIVDSLEKIVYSKPDGNKIDIPLI